MKEKLSTLAKKVSDFVSDKKNGTIKIVLFLFVFPILSIVLALFIMAHLLGGIGFIVSKVKSKSK
ncbi:MAG: hypothetical protein K5656_05160 [Lachnospiraceae bacterium]|nr:hypothetical protein [Lachnospiraceae bacterium]